MTRPVVLMTTMMMWWLLLHNAVFLSRNLNSKGVTVAFIYRYHSQDRTGASERLLGERLAFVFPVVGVRVHVLVNALDAHTCTWNRNSVSVTLTTLSTLAHCTFLTSSPALSSCQWMQRTSGTGDTVMLIWKNEGMNERMKIYTWRIKTAPRNLACSQRQIHIVHTCKLSQATKGHLYQ